MNFFEAEDTFFNVKNSLNCRGRLLDLSTPAIMGIINITPDSFYDGGSLSGPGAVEMQAEKMLEEGADILDIGGQSTRPGAKMLSPEEEWARLAPALGSLTKKFPAAILSIDTFYAEVARKALDEGVSIINDISAGALDASMFDFVAQSGAPYILMHMKGTPGDMQKHPQYKDVVEEVLQFFIRQVFRLRSIGVTDIILDPGFGFGKTVEHNYALLRSLPVFRMLNLPLLAGISRKSLVTKVLDLQPEAALNGTTALNTLALLGGASILRVHDVKEAAEVRKIITQYLLIDKYR
jgi:dihydropteroate synthase